MSLAPGVRLGAYEILALIGSGGMGVVYRGRDTKLSREVALKILPATFTNDPERLARFRREAQVLAALNHPHIAQIHGTDEANGTQFLVLELVDGVSLDKRIARGPIPVDEALPIARQIAEALEDAHEKGIVHRDLKPANIALTRDGQVKVLDFGLAKATEVTGGTSVDLANSPTITSPAMMSAVGVILGTAAYMAPEQAKGRPADRRSDIWAFGCVLYEMLTGKRAFAGDDVTETLAAVLKSDPNWDALPADTPAAVRKMLLRCLAKDSKRRLAEMASVRLEIDDALTAPSLDARSPDLAMRRSRLKARLPWIVTTFLFLALFIGIVMWAPWRARSFPSILRLTAELGVDASLAATNVGAAAILSPDGTQLAFVAQKSGGPRRLYVRRLDQLQAVPLAGTDGAESPFFSPDGQWLAFFADGLLKKSAVGGGPVVTICAAPSGRGGSWAEDGTIVFLPNAVPRVSLMRVLSSGGQPEPLGTLAAGESTQRWPQMLPGGKGVLYTSHRSTDSFEDANLVVQPLPTGERKIIYRGGHYGRYLASGHLVYAHDGTLFAAPFNLKRLEVSGPSVPVVAGVTANAAGTAGAQFAFSETGTLVLLPGVSAGLQPIHWMDRSGKTSPLRTARMRGSTPQFSPDGSRLAMTTYEGKQMAVSVYDWSRDTLSRLTFDPSDHFKPVWTPDGRRIAFASKRADHATWNIYWQAADGSGEAQRLTESNHAQVPASWHPRGKLLAFVELNQQGFYDVMILSLEGDEALGWRPGKPTLLVTGPFMKSEPMFSPDGRWLAYASNESGRSEVYVQPFPGPGGKWQISTGGGLTPRWSRTRHELFYGTGSQIMVAAYALNGNAFRAAKPKPWSEGRYVEGSPVSLFGSFDLHPNGDRFALTKAADADGPVKEDKVVFVFNFFDELRRIAPVKP